MGSLIKYKRVAKGKPTSKGRKQRRQMSRMSSKLNKALAPVELKFFDTAVSFLLDTVLEVPASGQWALIPQGDTQSTRDGRLARIKHIHFRGLVFGPSAQNSLSGTSFFIWVVLDRQANGAAAAATDVMTSTAPVSCLRNLNNAKRFKILHKEVVSPAKSGLADDATSTLSWPIEFNIPCDILMDWNSTTGAITEITSNNIFILAGAASASGAADDLFSVVGNARLRFYG